MYTLPPIIMQVENGSHEYYSYKFRIEQFSLPCGRKGSTESLGSLDLGTLGSRLYIQMCYIYIYIYVNVGAYTIH